MSTFTVDALGDTGVGSGTTGDLRYCVTQANIASGSSIDFNVSGTIQLTRALPSLVANVAIQGPGAAALTIEGGGASSNYSVITISKGVTAAISGLTISGGHSSTNGGAIDNLGDMTLTDCVISNDSALTGGGIYNTGTMTLTASTISKVAGTYGGGVTNYIGGTAVILACTITNNTAVNQGGGVSTYGNLALINSTIAGNTADSAGGIYVDSETGSTTVTNCTITRNRETKDGGGGIHAFGPTTLYNTIVCGNFGGVSPSTTPNDIAGSVNTVRSGSNLIGTGGSGGLTNGSHGNLVGVTNPVLGILGDNGGPTQTIALLAGSPAVDAGNDADAVDANGQALTTDQRGTGFPRILGVSVDIGAFESTPMAAPTVTALRASAASAVLGQPITFTATVGVPAAGGATPNGGLVTFSDQAGVLGSAALQNGVAEYTTSVLAAGTNTISASYGGNASFAPSVTGTITTIAGTGTAGYTGDSGPAIAAELSNPYGVASDSAGDIFIADFGNDVIREVIRATGKIITFAGNGKTGYTGDGGSATAAELNGPDGIAVDSAGDVFISDRDNNAIREVVKATGKIITVAGNGKAGYTGDNGPATAAELNSPRDISLDPAGDLFIADCLNNAIREVVKSTGKIITVAGNGKAGYSGDGGPATAAELNGPNAAAADSAGDVFIVDGANQVIRELVAANGEIITVAGNGSAGYSGDNGPATAAELSGPRGIALDSAGDLFFADWGNNAIREVVKATADIITVAGNGTAGYSGDNGPGAAAELNGAARVAIDSAGDLFVADANNNAIREVTPAVTVTVSSSTALPTLTALRASTASAILGQSVTLIATVSDLSAGGATPNGGLVTFSDQAGPIGSAALQNGVAEYTTSSLSTGTHTIMASYGGTGNFAPSTTGTITTVAGNGTAGYAGDGGPATAAELANTHDLAFDSEGDLFIADYGNNLVREVVKATGDIITVAGNGTAGYSGDNGLATAAELNGPRDLAFDAAGNLFISDSNNNVVRELVEATGNIITIAGNGIAGYGGNNGLATAAELSSPRGIALDSAGNLYIADCGNNVIREVVKSTGDIITVAGNGIAGYTGDNGHAAAAELNSPIGLAFDLAGDLYIADYENNVIREVVKATGNIVTVAGDGTAGYSGDNGPPTAAELDGAIGIAFDSIGDLFIAEQFNDVVREVVKATGNIVTVAGNSTAGYSGDDGPATAAELDQPLRVIVDSAGDLFVAEQLSNVVREITTPVTVAIMPATADRVMITSPALRLIAGGRAQMRLELEDPDGNPIVFTSAQTIDLSTSSTAGVFYATAVSSTPITDIVIPAGNSSATFYYSDTQAGFPAVQASDSVLNTAPAQVETINPDAAQSIQVTSTFANPDLAGAAASVSVAAIDGYGNIVGTGPDQYEGTVQLSSSDSRITGLPPSYNFSAADQGSHTFTGVVLETVGEQTITAADSVVSAITGSTTVNVLAGLPEAIKIVTRPPGGVIVGKPFSLTIDAEDSAGNLATSFNGSVTIGLANGSGGNLNGQLTMNASNGVATFSGLTDTMSGSLSIAATSGSLSPDTASDIAANPAPADHIVVTTSFANPDVAGTPGAITVTVVDFYGNPVASGPNRYLGTVDFGSTDLQVLGLPPSYAFTTADSGSHVFSNVELKTAGTQTVTVTDSATSTITGSATVHVVPAPASKLAITTSALTLIAGARGQITVQLEDAYDNLGATSSTAQTISLSTTGPTGSFFASQGSTSPITSVSITPGLSRASFYYGDNRVGTPTLTASDSALGSSSSQVETIDPALARSFRVTTSFANPDPAGTVGSVTVAAIDVYGNVAGRGPDEYEGTVNLSSTDSQASGVPASHTFTNSDAGSYTFTNVVLKTAGAQTIAATDSVASTLTGSVTESVSAIVASQLVVNTPPPGSITAGQPFTIVVWAEDRFHNVDPGWSGGVTIAMPGAPGFPITEPAQDGVATFAGLVLEAGSSGATFQASATGLRSGTTNPIPINPAPPPPPAPTIIGEQVVTKQNRNKKGKLVGKHIFVGFTLDYSIPMNQGNAGLATNYQVDFKTIKRVKKQTKTLLNRVNLTAAYDPSTKSVKLTILGNQKFAKGGEITVITTPPNGVDSEAGVALLSSDTRFTITASAKHITLG